MIKITALGRLTRDPELRDVNGTPCCTFSIAADTTRKAENTNNGYAGYVANFFRVTSWRKQAETMARLLHKGDQVVVVGNFEAREYQANNGTQATSLEISADTIQFCGGKRSQEASPATQQAAPAQSAAPADDLPF